MRGKEEVDNMRDYFIALTEAVGENSVSDGNFLSAEDRELEEKQRSSIAATLEAEYINAKVKIVDLGMF
jgi:hypothetical protein